MNSNRLDVSGIAANQTGLLTGAFDRFLITNYFDAMQKGLFSKGGIYAAIDGHVRRPDSLYFEVPETKAHDVAGYIGRTLQQHGSAYLKDVTTTVGGGCGVIKIYADDDHVHLVIPHSATRERIERNLGSLHGTEDFLYFFASHHLSENPRNVRIPILRTRADQPAGRIFDVMARRVLNPGEYAVEAPIKIPLYNGKTWEVRNLVQCPGGIPSVTAHYTKVGAGADFSNLLLGGEAHDSLEVLREIHKHAEKPESTALEYLHENKRTALAAADAFVSYCRKLALAHLEGTEAEQFYPREFSVDVTGEFFDGTLRPVVGELQYPLGFNSFRDSLLEVDPVALGRFDEIHDFMMRHDSELFLNLAARAEKTTSTL